MFTLGIETSCDETGAAVVEGGRRVVSNIVASSLSLHSKYGGVIPEIASRAQLEFIYPVVDKALGRAGLKIKDIALIAVTEKPGLRGSLLVGLSFARSLSFACGRPLVYVDHIKAHIYAAVFSARIRFPFIGLVVSGGHTNLFLVRDFSHFVLLGRSVDDAAGEAFDKTARILGLGYPGGPEVERTAGKGCPGQVRFACGNLSGKYDFSFSGIKTAVLYKSGNFRPAAGKRKRLVGKEVADIAYAFQEAVCDDIARKALAACRDKKIRSLVVGGGVAVNKRFRKKIKDGALANNLRAYFAAPQYCSDNAAMVAGMGYWLYQKR